MTADPTCLYAPQCGKVAIDIKKEVITTVASNRRSKRLLRKEGILRTTGRLYKPKAPRSLGHSSFIRIKHFYQAYLWVPR